MNTLPTIKFIRSSVPGKVPSVDAFTKSPLAINTYDGNIFIKRSRPGIGTDVFNISVGSSIQNIIYVTKDGKDTNTGLRPGDAKATIKAAVAIAKPGNTIEIASGTYIEDNPITIPDQVSFSGSNLREVSIEPLNSDQDLFYWGSGNQFENVSFYGSMPGKAVFSFDPVNQRYINQSPYVRNCTNFIPRSIGMKIDGDLVLGPLKSMVVDSYTQYNQGGIGVSITNSAYAQLVSIFTICNNIAIYCGSGGACDLTNSNSSFGTFGLIADGVSPLKYSGIITANAGSDNNIFDVDLSTPTFNVVNALYDNTTGITTIYTNQPHRFNVGMGVSVVGLGFTCDTTAGILTYPSGLKGYTFEVKTVAPGRYIDAANSINANKQEIIDKSLASVAIDYPDFYFPGDSQTNARSRYYDAYRLIQKNKQEIINTAWTNTAAQYPGISTTQTKCKRDLGYFVDAVSTDVFTGGNKYAVEFVKQYFTGSGVPISNGLVGEETESVYAFVQARQLIKQAITNNLTVKDLSLTTGPATYNGPGGNIPNTNSGACFDVQSNVDNLVGIITSVITAGNLTGLPSINSGNFTDGGSKCSRDLGYIVDAISSDLRNYTNSEIIKATKFYFNKNGTLINNGLVGELNQSITAFASARDYAKLAINNQLNSKNYSLVADPLTGFNTSPNSCADVQSTIDTLVGILTTNLGNQNLNSLPNVSLASTVFTVNVGVSTLRHYYNSGGIVKCDVVRPFDGQAVYFGDLYNDIESIAIGVGGTGYSFVPNITIENPDTDWGVAAQVVANVENGSITSIDIVSSGRGYTRTPKVTVDGPTVGVNTAKLSAVIRPNYYSIANSTPLGNNKYRITLNENVPSNVGIGTVVYFYKQSRILASGHSVQYIGSGDYIDNALPWLGGVPIQENETVSKNGGLVVYTTTDQSGNFRIGDGVVVNQNTGTISGSSYTKSLFSTLTPFILALGGD